ncbi:hypothetical protein LTR94_037256, partial [Friedmanniomyces endolithicus]
VQAQRSGAIGPGRPTADQRRRRQPGPGRRLGRLHAPLRPLQRSGNAQRPGRPRRRAGVERHRAGPDAEALRQRSSGSQRLAVDHQVRGHRP